MNYGIADIVNGVICLAWLSVFTVESHQISRWSDMTSKILKLGHMALTSLAPIAILSSLDRYIPYKLEYILDYYTSSTLITILLYLNITFYVTFLHTLNCIIPNVFKSPTKRLAVSAITVGLPINATIVVAVLTDKFWLSGVSILVGSLTTTVCQIGINVAVVKLFIRTRKVDLFEHTKTTLNLPLACLNTFTKHGVTIFTHQPVNCFTFEKH
jgi:hypothetical protein